VPQTTNLALLPRVETKTFFSIFAKSKNDAKNEQIFAKFCFVKIFVLAKVFAKIFIYAKFLFPSKFSRKWVRFCVNIFIMINSNGNLMILVHVHYCCPFCFEAPSGFDNFEVHGGQYCLSNLF
jgi:hypothetical protein